MKRLERDWYQASLTGLTFCLLPLSWIFRAIVAARRFLYRIHLKKTYQFQTPIIIVGNITVGGTGKTPFVIWLAEVLREKGYTPGIVSRGVGGNKKIKPRWITLQSDVREVGDEAMLLLKRTECPLVVGVDRVACVKELLANTKCDVVISDDGLQHYRLGRKVEIALIDGARSLGNQQLLPAGPLREPASRLDEVDFIVRQGDSLFGEYNMKLEGNELVSVKDTAIKMPLQKMRVHAVAAIGNPKRFFDSLRKQNLDVIEHAFLDHAFFKKEDFDFGDALPIVMTEKDAVKCGAFADERFWFLPVQAKLDAVLIEKMVKILNRID